MAETPDSEVVLRNDFPQYDEMGQGDIPVHVNENVSYEDEQNINDNPLPIAHTRAHNPSSHRHVLMKPESYDGRGDWEEYFSHFNDCAELGRWSEEDKVLTLAASLRGPARTFYIGLTTAERRSYAALVSKLERRFGSSHQQTKWLTRMEMRRRMPDESVASLGDDLRQISQKAYSNLDSTAQEALALNQLYKIVPMEMKCRCIEKECRNVSDAVGVIELYEALFEETKERKRMGVRAVNVVPPANEDGILYDKLCRGIEEICQRLTRLERATPTKSNRTCFNCNSPDHFMRECPEMRLQRGNVRPAGPTRQGNGRPSTF